MTKGFGDWERRLQEGCRDAASAALDGNDSLFLRGRAVRFAANPLLR